MITPNTAPYVEYLHVGHSTRPEDLHGIWRLYPPERYSSLAIGFNEPMHGEIPPSSAFTVTARPRDGGRAVTVSGSGEVQHQGDSIYMRLAEPVPRDAVVTVTYVKPSEHPLRDRDGLELEGFTDRPANNGAPRIESLALVSDPARGRTYGRDEKVRVQVTFTGPVVVRGTPRLRITLGRTGFQTGDMRWVPYESGSGTTALTFAYTVQAGDSTAAVQGNADEGIAVNSHSLHFNGGTIRSKSEWDRDAELAHPWLPYDARHRVDGGVKVPLFQSASVDGTALTVTFDETLDASRVPAPGAFHVTVNDARRSVASGERGHLRRDGDADPGLGGGSRSDTVTVRYTKPSANPLQSASGQAVETFADQEVTEHRPRKPSGRPR